MRCPFCLSDNLEAKEEEDLPFLETGTVTCQCCEDCGGSFQVINTPQEILLKDRQDFINKVEELEK